jgi:hypothetical protein
MHLIKYSSLLDGHTSSRFAAFTLCFAASLWAMESHGSQPELHSLHTYGDFLDGEFENTSLLPNGEVVLGPSTQVIAKGLPGPVMDLVETGDGRLFVATAKPAKIFEIPKKGPPKLWATLDAPLVTKLLPWKKDRLIALLGPNKGLWVFDLKAPKEKRIVQKVAFKGKGLLFDAAWSGKELLIVGGGKEGALLKWVPGQKEFKVLATVEEKYLRSIASRRTKQGNIVAIGSAEKGVVYQWSASDGLKAKFDAEPGEVTDIVIDSSGTIFAAFVDANGKLTKNITSRSKGPKEKKSNGKKPKKKAKKPRAVKSSEVIRIDPNGQIEVLWQSKKHGGYALALVRGQLLLGTGSDGRIYSLDPSGEQRAQLYSRVKEHDEISTIHVSKKRGLLLGTNHGNGVHILSTSMAMSGVYFSAPLNAKSMAHYGELAWESRVPQGTQLEFSVRVGNTEEPDSTWSKFSPAIVAPGHPGLGVGQYAQIRVKLNRKGKNVPSFSSLRLAYLVDNRRPMIGKVEVLSNGWHVERRKREKTKNRTVTIGEDAFEKFLDIGGQRLPSGKKRASVQQTVKEGARTVFVWAEDLDHDVLRYRFFIGALDNENRVQKWEPLKEWSGDAFVSLDGRRLKEGRYRIQCEVDDVPTNGFERARRDKGVSPIFEIARTEPAFSQIRAFGTEKETQIEFELAAAFPLAAVQCAAAKEEWVPLTPADGILDGKKERFSVSFPGPFLFKAISCVAIDEAGNAARADIPIKSR